jgi:phosphoglycerate dehydrogenase-like enzyme
MRVGVTADIRGSDGRPVYDLSLLDESPRIDWEWIRGEGELSAEDAASLDAIVLFHPVVTARTVAGESPPRLIARLGVGVDNIDVDACTEAGVVVTVTPDSVRRPMASGAMAFVLALAHRLPEMDRHVRGGGWDRFAHVGSGLRGRTLGIVGLGNVGRELAALASGFGLEIVASDPFVSQAPADVELRELDELLAEADFVVVTCPLTPETRHLLDARRLALMRPTAYLVNIARGPIVDGAALADALRRRAIAGAALDVFENEPPGSDDPLLALDNVILAPHAVGLTDELFRLGGESVCRAVLAVARGQLPEFPLNPEAFDRVSAARSP